MLELLDSKILGQRCSILELLLEKHLYLVLLVSNIDIRFLERE